MKLNFFLRKNQKGQVAIFVALIFQVLFLFFAMIINVGLLVHHKINLQNSVDLAAYYGATKQAEMLNAIAHINYQIRQSWKLLTWRYRQVGSAGAFSKAHPFNKAQDGLDICQPAGWCPAPAGENILPDESFKAFYDAPSFCVTYVPFRPMPQNENTCKQAAERNSRVVLPSVPRITAPFLGFSQQTARMTEMFLRAMEDRCQIMGPWNYINLARFVTTFNMDQGERKMLIRHLAMGLSDSQDEFRDIDGDRVSEGIRETLKRNLTSPNLEGFSETDFKIVNSLGFDSCNGSGVGAYDPPKWLSEIRIHPSFLYTDTSCSNKAVETHTVELHTAPLHRNVNSEFNRLITYFEPYVQGGPTGAETPFKFSIGFEKNPWCMAYVGVKAKTVPKIPFAPLGNVELTARAFAKPFGGRIGPWWGQRWPKGPPGANAQSEGDRTDPLLPLRARDLQALGNSIGDVTRYANYSKYPGDQLGLKSRLTLGQFGKAIYAMDKDFRRVNYENHPGIANPDEADAPNFKHWEHLGTPFRDEGSGDILAYDSRTRKENPMRRLELLAVAPDLFDISYYSIEPDFYNVYFKRIRDGFLRKTGGYDYLPRSDIGSRVGDPEAESFSVRDQMEVVKKVADMNPGPVDIKNALTYIGLIQGNSSGQVEMDPLLTGWVGKSLSDYSLNDNAFGRCKVAPMAEAPTSGKCVGPGRTGYSVKLISKDYLFGNQPIGGEGVSGTIENPPPRDF